LLITIQKQTTHHLIHVLRLDNGGFLGLHHSHHLSLRSPLLCLGLFKDNELMTERGWWRVAYQLQLQGGDLTLLLLHLCLHQLQLLSSRHLTIPIRQTTTR
jgi:hypothetical protein